MSCSFCHLSVVVFWHLQWLLRDIDADKENQAPGCPRTCYLTISLDRSVCVWACVHVYACVCGCICVQVCTCMHVYVIHVQVHVCVLMCMHVCVCVGTCGYMCVCHRVHMCVNVYACARVHVSTCEWAHGLWTMCVAVYSSVHTHRPEKDIKCPALSLSALFSWDRIDLRTPKCLGCREERSWSAWVLCEGSKFVCLWQGGITSGFEVRKFYGEIYVWTKLHGNRVVNRLRGREIK